MVDLLDIIELLYITYKVIKSKVPFPQQFQPVHHSLTMFEQPVAYKTQPPNAKLCSHPIRRVDKKRQ